MKIVPRSDRGRLLLALGVTIAIVTPIGWMWYSSLIPDTYDMADMGYADYGGGPHVSHHDEHAIPVAELVEPATRKADVEVELTASQDGDRYLVNGGTPGPTIHATQGDLVEVSLLNENVDEGVALHWHGIDVPNAMDGVAGVTQDAVGAGESYTYRFVVEDAGTYWYHSHQISHEQVRGGLLGGFVVAPRDEGAPSAPGPVADVDALAMLHRYGNTPTLNGDEGIHTLAAEPGDEVRIRVVNTNNALMPVWVTGAPYRILAVDGRDLNAPGEVTGTVRVPAGGRVDLGVVVPAGGARVEFASTTALVLGVDPAEGEPPDQPEEFVDLLSYGEPTDPGIDATDPDRRFDYSIGRRIGFLDGKPGRWWTINGGIFPDVPMYMVEEGDVVVFRVENHSGEPHPMHLHGHHALVLSRNGEASTGSPWWIDSLEVSADEEYEIAVLADNPGIWMDHCHNLPHAVEGLTAHMMYAGVTSSFKIGDDADNHPE